MKFFNGKILYQLFENTDHHQSVEETLYYKKTTKRIGLFSIRLDTHVYNGVEANRAMKIILYRLD